MLFLPLNSPASTPRGLSSPSSPSSTLKKNVINTNNNLQNRSIIVSSDHHFSFTIMVNTPHYLKDKQPIYPCMLVSNTTKTLHGENFQVLLFEYNILYYFYLYCLYF